MGPESGVVMYREMQGQWSVAQVTSTAPLTPPAAARVLQVLCNGGATGGTVVIFGQTITLAASQEVDLRMMHACCVPQPGSSPKQQITSTSTATAVVEYVTPGSSI